MLEIKSLDDVRGNNVVIYSIKTLISKGSYPHFSILAGNMGVGKSTVANLVGAELNRGLRPTVFNFGLDVDMEEVESLVFKMNPSEPKAFIFEEMQGMSKPNQTALLTMLDKQPANVYVIGTTTEENRILRTVRSRATIWSFKLLGERQLTQLLDDYLRLQGVELSREAKTSLLKSCYGVPRDLLKNTDLAISGEFTGEQLDQLMGRVSEDLIFSVLCSLKSKSIDFVTNVTALMDEAGSNKLASIRDFYTRFLLERSGIPNPTLSAEKITMLNSIFKVDELERIGRTLVRATQDTLILELSLLNMELTGSGNKQLIGQQVDRLAVNQASATATVASDEVATRRDRAKVSPSSLKGLQL